MSNTGLYEDSDHDSLYEESPTDGYFDRRPHPQESFVDDPSARLEEEAKAREAAEERQRSESVARRPSENSRTFDRSPVWADEGVQILDAGPAPPDYMSATADRQDGSQGETSHQTESSSARSDAYRSHREHTPPSSYGSIHSPPPEIQGNTPQDSNNWSFGHGGVLGRNGPFPHGSPQNGNFPFGPNGSPFYTNFPLGPNGGPFGIQGPFANRRAPESMSVATPAAQAPEVQDEESGLLGRGRRRGSRRHGRPQKWYRAGGCFSSKVLINSILVLGIVVVIVMLGRATREASKSTKDPVSQPDVPTHKPDNGSSHDDKKYRYTPHSPEDLPEGTFPGHTSTAKCQFTHFHSASSFGYQRVEDFSFIEMMEPSNQFAGGLSGDVWIVFAPPEQDRDVWVFAEYATTNPYESLNSRISIDDEGFTIQRPTVKASQDEYAGKPCLSLAVTIFVKPTITLANFELSTANLNVVVKDGVFNPEHLQGLHISNTSTISAMSGDLTAAHWSSRETRIELSSGTVRGDFALRDLLSVRTQSGSISVSVDPKESDATHPKPAEFTAMSSSGRIVARFPTGGDIPERDYRTLVSSSSGSVSGSYIHGSTSSFSSHSSSVEVDVLPYFAKQHASYENSLQSDSGSGSTRLELLPPYNEPGTVISGLHSTHKSTSGSVRIQYPQEWQGTIKAQTASGSLRVDGKDVVVDAEYPLGHLNKRSNPAGYMRRHFLGRKGQIGWSRLDMRTSSGSISATIGDT